MSAITPDRYNDFARPRILIKVTFLKHFELEVWVSIFFYHLKGVCVCVCGGGVNLKTCLRYPALTEIYFLVRADMCVAPSQTQLRTCVINIGHIQWKCHLMFFPYHRGLLLKERIRSLWEQILTFKRGPNF